MIIKTNSEHSSAWPEPVAAQKLQAMGYYVAEDPTDVISDDDDDDDDDDTDMSSYSGDDDSDMDESLEMIEERVNNFARVGSTPALAALVFDENVKLPVTRNKHSKNAHLNRALSASFHELPKEEQKAVEAVMQFVIRKSSSEVCLQSMSQTKREESLSRSNATFTNSTKPEDHLDEILGEQGTSYQAVDAMSLQNFFVELQPENFAGYDNEIAAASRSGDVDVFRRRHASGASILCCNNFRETVVHTICRRGHDDLLRYLLNETDTPIQLRDEQGRTPLHDAAWTHTPNFELVKLLLQRCPDLLYIKDIRGFTPLAYVGKTCCGPWCEFLDKNRDILTPTQLRGHSS